MNETFPYILPGWMAEKVGGSNVMISSRVTAELRPPDPGGGDVRLRYPQCWSM